MAEIRLLGEDDRAAVETLLELHAETSMFLRSNLAQAGFHYGGQRLQAEYFGRATADTLHDIVAHCWNGVLLLQTPNIDRELIVHAVEQSNRGVSGVIGPWPQVQVAIEALGFRSRPRDLDSCEDLFSLRLTNLSVPAALEECDCRLASSSDVDRLAPWRVIYDRETLGKQTNLEAAREQLRPSIAAGTTYVLDKDGEALAMTQFNAVLSDCVQVGGVFAPPSLRRQGYARSVVAGSLLHRQEQGVERAILFTGKENIAARKAYESLGFRHIGDYGVVLFDET